MIKYREHRGSLEESLKTSMRFDSLKELFDFISEKRGKYFNERIYLETIKIVYHGFDARCNQMLFMVKSDHYEGLGFIYED